MLPVNSHTFLFIQMRCGNGILRLISSELKSKQKLHDFKDKPLRSGKLFEINIKNTPFFNTLHLRDDN